MILRQRGLFAALGVDELAVEASDVAQRNALWAFCSACASVGAIAEAKLVHLLHHCASATLALNLTLRKKSELANLSRNEEHGRAILAGSNASAAANAGGRVHGNVGHFLRDWR